MSSLSQWLANIRSPGGAAQSVSTASLLTDPDLKLRQIDWLQFQWRPSLRRIPAIVLMLAAGVYFQQTAAGVLAAGTALSIGFGANRQVCHSRLQAMVLTTLFVAVAGFAGSLVGNIYVAVVLATFLFGFSSGLLSVVNEDIGWIAMQGAIAFLIASAFPSDLKFALLRTSFVLIGGGVQILCILLIWLLEDIGRFGPESAPSHSPIGRGSRFAELWQNIIHPAAASTVAFSSIAFRFAFRVGATLALAVEMDHQLGLKNGYWLPMATLIVLKPDFSHTYVNGVQRVVGTLAGVIAASLIAHLIRPETAALISLVAVLGFFTYAFQKANPVIFSAALTSFVVFMIAVTGLPEASVTWHRLINTSLGCALALTSYSIGFLALRRMLHGPPTPAKI